MGAALAYEPGDYQHILGVEDAYSNRRRGADCTGTEFRPIINKSGGSTGSVDDSTIWLDVDEPTYSATTMADWPTSWESANASPQASPIGSSPLQSSSSHSSHEYGSLPPPQLDVDAGRPGGQGISSITTSTSGANASRVSLVETLQTCLTSLPPTSSSSPAAPPGPESRASGSRALGPSSPTTKPGKRRSRASRRVPTTVLEASASDFRHLVQRLTGVPASSPAPVRPLPQRAAPGSTFIRPDHRPLMAPTRPLISPTRPLVAPTRPHPTATANSSAPINYFIPHNPATSNTARFDEQLLRPPFSRSHSHLANPLRSSTHVGSSSGSPFSSSYDSSTATTRTLPAQDSSSCRISLPVTSFPNAVDIGIRNVESSAAEALGLLTVPEENVEFSISQFDDWLSGDDH